VPFLLSKRKRTAAKATENAALGASLAVLASRGYEKLLRALISRQPYWLCAGGGAIEAESGRIVAVRPIVQISQFAKDWLSNAAAPAWISSPCVSAGAAMRHAVLPYRA